MRLLKAIKCFARESVLYSINSKKSTIICCFQSRECMLLVLVTRAHMTADSIGHAKTASIECGIHHVKTSTAQCKMKEGISRTATIELLE